MPENLLLAVLPNDERRRLDRFLEPVPMEVMDVLIEANEPIEYVYFPYDAITSTVQEMRDGSTIEVGLMGIEGFIGVQLWLRSQTTPTRTLIQVGGSGHRMDAVTFTREVMQKASPLNDWIARYSHAFLVMVSQTAACNRLHTVDMRLCRWLAMTQNRLQRSDFSLRQEFLAQMLGVHRPSVSIAANILQKAGLISYSRGRIRIEDLEGLEEGACECYDIVETQFDRMFGQPWREMAKEQHAAEAGSPTP